MVKKTEDIVEGAEAPIFVIGDRVEKLCLKCGEERGHVIASLSQTRENIASELCEMRHPGNVQEWCFERVKGAKLNRVGLTISLAHIALGRPCSIPLLPGEVTAVIEPLKIDVLFSDRMRRLVHARPAMKELVTH